MSDLRTAAQQALEVLIRASSYYDTYPEIAALEAALAEPKHKPHCALLKIPSRDCDCSAEPVQEPTVPSDCADSHQPVAWTDADADAARLAMELEALLLSCKDTAAVSRWWDSAHDALDLHRQRLARAIERAHGIGGQDE